MIGGALAIVCGSLVVDVLDIGKKVVKSAYATNGIQTAIGEGQVADRRQDRELEELRRIAQVHEALLGQFNGFMIRDEKWKADITRVLAKMAVRRK